MKNAVLLLFMSILSFSVIAQKNYDAEWKKVDDLINKKNLRATALTEVKKIYALAQKEGQDAQVIKALVYMSNLQEQAREDNIQLSIREFEAESIKAKEPAASIIKSLIADLYWKYLQHNRWKLFNRTNTAAFEKKDIETWTLEDLHKEIGKYYLASIQKDALLKQTALPTYDAIITKGNVRSLRPTLYDLLAHKALDYFKNDERDIKKPAYAFEIGQPEAFAPAATFASYRFQTRDTLSLHFKALKVYQDLIRFHIAEKRMDALVDVDIDRIQFVYQHSTAPNKDELYATALDRIVQTFPANAQAVQASFLLAVYYEQLAGKYDPLKDTAHRYARVKARDILLKAIRDSASFGNAKKTSEGFTNSLNLLKETERSYFETELEKVNLPVKPFRALVKYKNITSIYYRVIKKDKALDSKLESTEDFWGDLISAQHIRTWKQDLPSTNDLQQHSVEVKIDGLPAGEYYLLASGDGQFRKSEKGLGAQVFYVSSISYVNQSNRFFVLHRESGQPLAKANVELFSNEYNYTTYKYKKVRTGSYQADQNGYLELPFKQGERNNGYFIEVEHGGERLSIDDAGQYYYYNGEDRRMRSGTEQTRVFFFTDRSLYRPGQTVYFKGIAMVPVDKQHRIVADYSNTIYLRDVNFQLVDSLKVTGNEFGSFNGKFQLPQNLLNGNFYITDKEGRNTLNISVEEYKRPKFFVEIDKPAKPYKAGEQIKLSGFAKAYAGNQVDGAKVSYRVVRQPRFIYRWGWWPNASEPMEIAHGTAVTGADGKFTIEFTAIPDRTIDSATNPIFDYRVMVDVTDINGETRSAQKVVSASYRSVILHFGAEERVPVDSLLSISLRTTNMNDEHLSTRAFVSIRKLLPENRLVRERYWQQPDQFVMSKEEFLKHFPLDEYRKETDPTTWEKRDVIFRFTDTTSSVGRFILPDAKLAAGWYEIEVYVKDKDGKEVKDKRIIEVYDAKSRKPQTPQYLFADIPTKPHEPGETVRAQVGTSATNVYLVHEVGLMNDEIKRSFTQLSDEKIEKAYHVDESDRGGFSLNYFFVKDNRFFQKIQVANVPWSNKDLDIQFSTFRDKTLPGSEEKWSVTIKGDKGTKVAAEMLASMYDASLDQFKAHNWDKPNVWPSYMKNLSWNKGQNFIATQSAFYFPEQPYIRSFEKQYDELIGFADFRRNYMRAEFGRAAGLEEVTVTSSNQRHMRLSAPVANQAMDVDDVSPYRGNKFEKEYKDGSYTFKADTASELPAEATSNIQIRKNFNETAFFFPDLRTDAEGNISFSFTAPEALTTWKLQTLAHTKDLAFGMNKKEIITQKELMVMPNAPRFVRQGDRLEFAVKVVNLTDKEMTGQAELQLVDPATGVSVDGWMQNVFPNQYFTVAAGATEVVKFPFEVPYQYTSGLTWRVIARSGSVSDGEEMSLPVLTNKILVTETLPLPMRGTGTKSFTFNSILNSGQSETAVNHALTVEFTSNPAWYAVQALPYLMEYPYDCAEQNWNRFYANALATKIANSAPRIKAIFEKWTLDAKADTGKALLSALQKNQELKSALLEETPWVMDAKNEEQQKKNLGILFDMVRMSKELKTSLEKLRQTQSSNGGFVWFKGGPDDRYITQYIVAGIGHLKKLGAIPQGMEKELNEIVRPALAYLDRKIQEDHKRLITAKANLKLQQISYIQIHYLYTRTFFPEIAVLKSAESATSFYWKQAADYWMKQGRYLQGMTALALHRHGNKTVSLDIMRSLKENAIRSEEMGMYWKDVQFGKSWYWYDAPIETQALMIEAFNEITKDIATVDDLKTWLLKNKQTTNWRTTKATAEACYALLLQGTDWLKAEPMVQVKLGNVTANNSSGAEAGTGYFKKRVEGNFITPEMGNVSVTVNSSASVSATWGAIYYQYFEDMDKVKSASTPLQLNKKLFVEKNTDRGPVLTPVQDGQALKVGDKLKVRIEIRVDRDMEYVHMKDLRASALEPVNVLSGYKWQGGLGYYETTRDASTNFFFNYLRKGTYVFEYPMFVTHTGNFSNGITTIQSMYAPEFSAHSEGVRITVE